MPPETQQRKRFNNELFHRVLIYAACLLVAASWTFFTSRASEDDLKKLEEQHKADVRDVKKSLKTLETNSVRICQFLDRQDKAAGGPGIQCRDPD